MRALFLTLVIAAASGTPADEAPDSGPLVLDARRCAALALEHNPRAAAAREDAEAAEARARQARAHRLPQVRAEAAYTYIKGLPVNLYTGGALSFLAGAVEAEKWQVAGGVVAEQVLFAGGRLHAAQRASEYLARSEAWKERAAREETVLQARRAFHDALLARMLEEAAALRAGAFERHLADSRAAFETGLVSRFQVLRAETELGARQAEFVSARSAARLAQVELLRAIGLPQDTPVTLEAPAGDMISPRPDALDAAVAEALDRRAELRALEEGIAAAAQHERERRGQYLPRAAAQVRYDDFAGGVSVNPKGWSVNVGVEWELFASGRRSAETAEARARRRSLEYQRDEVRHLVELDVRRAWMQVEEAQARISAEEKTVGLAEEGLRMAELRYQEGVGTQSEVLDAEVALHVARTQLANARRDLEVALATLDRATGREWPPKED